MWPPCWKSTVFSSRARCLRNLLVCGCAPERNISEEKGLDHMDTPMQLRHHKVRRWHLLALTGFLVCCLAVTALSLLVLPEHPLVGASTLSMSANGAQASQGLDPTKLIADPA